MVWEEVTGFLGSQKTFQHEMGRRWEATTGQESEIREKMAGVKRKLEDVDRRETDLVGLRLRGTVSDEALDRNAALIRAERAHYQDETDRLKAALATLEQSQAAVASLEALRQRVVDHLDSTTPEDRRTVLEALDTRVTVGPGGVLDLSIGVPQLSEAKPRSYRRRTNRGVVPMRSELRHSHPEEGFRKRTKIRPEPRTPNP